MSFLERGVTSQQRRTRDLFDRYSGVIYSKCRRMLGNKEDAADAVQETFAKAFCAIDTLRDGDSEMAWLYRIATTTCLNFIRTRNRKGAVLLEELGHLVSDGKGPLDVLQSQRLYQALQDQCDERTLEIFVACYVDGMDQGQIAAQLDISRRAVVKRLSRFRQLAEAIHAREIG